MIKFYFKWIIIRSIRNLTSPVFYIMTLLIALGFWLTDEAVKNYSDTVVVLIWADEGTEGSFVAEYLENNSPEGYAFVRALSRESLVEEVGKGNASCGVAFPEQTEGSGAGDNITAGDTGGKGERVVIYQTAGSPEGYIVREVVYPVIQRSNAPGRLREYMLSAYNDTIPTEEAIAYVEERYLNYLDNLNIQIYNLTETERAASDRHTSKEEEKLNIFPNEDTKVQNGELSSLSSEDSTRTKRYIYGFILLLTGAMCMYDISRCDKSFYRAFGAGRRIMLMMSSAVAMMLISTGTAIVILKLI